jgi:hypothetical protein
MVRRRLLVTPAVLAKLSRQSVPAEDLEHFTELALTELTELHEGNIARFRIRPSEFQLWATQRDATRRGRPTEQR